MMPTSFRCFDKHQSKVWGSLIGNFRFINFNSKIIFKGVENRNNKPITLLNKKEKMNFSLFENHQKLMKTEEKTMKKGETKIFCNYSLSQVQLDCAKLELSSQHQGY